MKSIPRNKQPNPMLLQALLDQSHPYGDSLILGPRGLELAEIEYQRCLGFHEEFGSTGNPSVVAMHLMRNFTRIHQLEAPIREQLQELAKAAVIELFQVPEEEIEVTATIDPEMTAEISQDTPVDVDPEKLQPHVEKRIILNSLVHGAAVHIWKSLHFTIEDKLNELNPELFQLYNETIADASYLMWQAPPLSPEDAIIAFQMPGVVQGQNQVNIDEDQAKATVQATATMFPTMVHEIVKGIFDLIILHGIDEDLTEDELEYVYQKADQHHDELWYTLMGPGLWFLIVDNYVDNPEELPDTMQSISVTSIAVIIEELNRVIDEHARDETPD